MRLTAFVHDLANNATGRAYSLWLLAQHLGYEFETIGPSSTGAVWPVVAGTEFAAHCTVLPTDAFEAAVSLAAKADVLVSVKAIPESLGLASRVSERLHLPLLADVDDPDSEVLLASVAQQLRKARRPATVARILRRRRELRRARALVTKLPVAVSNPGLQALYGGELIPHVRLLQPARPPRDTTGMTVAFVGTARRHKGIDVLRDAIAELAEEGVTLVATAEPPADRKPWERWVGESDFETGQAIIDAADVLVVPSLDAEYGRLQLPVKLIDAMAAGKAIIASDLPPIRWALADTGLLATPGSVPALSAALHELTSSASRSEFEQRAQARAVAMFTPEAVAPSFAELLDRLR